MNKIAQNNLQKYGPGGFSVSVPKIFVSDNNLAGGDAIRVYRSNIKGVDVLILSPIDIPVNGNITNNQSKNPVNITEQEQLNPNN